IRAVQEALERRNVAGRVSRPDFAVRGNLGIFQIDFPDQGPLVTIIIPTRNRLDLLQPCVRAVLERTQYHPYELLIIDNESDDPQTLDFLDSLPGHCRV